MLRIFHTLIVVPAFMGLLQNVAIQASHQFSNGTWRGGSACKVDAPEPVIYRQSLNDDEAVVDLFNTVNVDQIKRLLKGGANVKALHEGYPPIIWAFDPPEPHHASVWPELNKAVIETLVEHGADPNVISAHNQSPLSYASFIGNIDLVRFLLKHGAKTQYPPGDNPLNYGVEHITIERLLLAHGAHVNRPSAQGETPLISAAFYGSLKTVKLFVQRGANVNAHNDEGVTPLMNEAHRSGPDRLAGVRLLLAYGARVNAKADNGCTPLHFSVSISGEPNPNRELIVRELIRHGADVNARNNEGWTPLMMAAQGHSPESIRMLLAYGADTRAVGKNGETVLTLNPGLKEELEKAEAAHALNSLEPVVNPTDDSRVSKMIVPFRLRNGARLEVQWDGEGKPKGVLRIVGTKDPLYFFSIAGMRNQVRIKTGRQALSFARLYTTPQTWHCGWILVTHPKGRIRAIELLCKSDAPDRETAVVSNSLFQRLLLSPVTVQWTGHHWFIHRSLILLASIDRMNRGMIYRSKEDVWPNGQYEHRIIQSIGNADSYGIRYPSQLW